MLISGRGLSLKSLLKSWQLCPVSVYRIEKVVASKQLKFAMEMDVERKARLEKMAATTQLRLALETEKERRAKKGLNLIQNLFFLQGMSSLTL